MKHSKPILTNHDIRRYRCSRLDTAAHRVALQIVSRGKSHVVITLSNATARDLTAQGHNLVEVV
jgi:hypothetical protein